MEITTEKLQCVQKLFSNEIDFQVLSLNLKPEYIVSPKILQKMFHKDVKTPEALNNTVLNSNLLRLYMIIIYVIKNEPTPDEKHRDYDKIIILQQSFKESYKKFLTNLAINKDRDSFKILNVFEKLLCTFYYLNAIVSKYKCQYDDLKYIIDMDYENLPENIFSTELFKGELSEEQVKEKNEHEHVFLERQVYYVSIIQKLYKEKYNLLKNNH